LAERKVDLVLQGHDHSYQRSNQLGRGAACPQLVPDQYNPGCVVDDGGDGLYTAGAGPVLIIAGNFGRSSVALNSSDPEAGYFAAWLDPDLDSNGFVKFIVSKESISGEYMDSSGLFSDHFSIQAVEAPIPTPSPTPPTATKEFTFTAEADSYVLASGAADTFGHSEALRVDSSPETRAYLRFNVAGVTGSIIRARLFVHANSASSRGYRVHAVTDGTWTEACLTYDNSPPVGIIGGISGPFAAGNWTTVDVSSLVTGSGAVDLAMTGIDDTAIAFSSREGAQPPVLVVTASAVGSPDLAVGVHTHPPVDGTSFTAPPGLPSQVVLPECAAIQLYLPAILLK
jgi:hypothetical protein